MHVKKQVLKYQIWPKASTTLHNMGAHLGFKKEEGESHLKILKLW